MKTVGIICEYNPFHLGHASHIEKTKEAMVSDAYIVCVMSGNYVQRGDFAIFNKHARAKMAVLCGADIVIELPTAYALLSAGGFANAGVYLLDSLGICDYLSFGSESGDVEDLRFAAQAILSTEADMHIREGLSRGLPYATAQQRAADLLLGENANVFSLPNNLLGIEYIKAIGEQGSFIEPMTIRRTGGEHDGDFGYSASALRKVFLHGNVPMEQMPGASVAVSMEEIALGRHAVQTSHAEQAILSRLRQIDDFSIIPGASDGLDRRFLRFAPVAPSINSLLRSIKTKRYAMSRIKRTLLCAVVGISNTDIEKPPPYCRLLAMNERGMEILKAVNKTSRLPIITKPASVNRLDKQSVNMFNLEASATDLYVLAYTKEEHRTGGMEWKQSPIVVS